MKIDFKKIKNNLMTGISYMIPLTVIGGICYAGAIALGGQLLKVKEWLLQMKYYYIFKK